MQAQKKASRAKEDDSYRGLVDAITEIAVYRLDRTGQVRSWNPGAQRLKGYLAAEIVGQPFSCFYTDEDRKKGLPLLALKQAERDGNFETEGWRVRKDGSRFWAHVVIDPIRNESGQTIGFAKVTHDVSKTHERALQIEDVNAKLERQVHARTALLQSLTLLQRAILTHAAVGIIATDVEGTITLFNPAAERMLAYHATELVGKQTPEILLDPAEMAAQAEAISIELGMTFDSGFQASISKARTGAPYSNEVTFIRKDGSRLPVLLNVSALRDEEGEIFGYLGMAIDLAERRERERLLAARTGEAEAAVQAKSQFLANMSHEIRSPMNAILGMLQVLLQTDLSPSQTDYAGKAFSATESLLRLLNDILDFSKIEADKVVLEQAPFSLDALMCDLQSLTATAIGDKPVGLDFSVEPGLRDLVVGDGFRLRQVLLNLVGNAIKFTERGLVRVSLRRPPGERRHSMVEFSVEDTGIGIPAEKLDSIFTDFQQADASTTRRYGGTGLGLTISRKLIALMGGRLDVESDVGVGSRFSFSLSLQRASQEQPVARPPSPNANALAGLKLLVVEDMPLNQEVAKHLLTNAGADVTVAESGSLAIDLALAAEPPFDAVLMDLQMPGMDGLETTRRLRATPKLAATPIIAMTANIMASDKQACLEAGMNDHVGKPFHIADMIAAIQAQQPPRRKIIPLVTVKLALHRLAGDKALFIKIARQLKDDLPPMLDQLADAVTRQVPAEGVAVMHKLKSLAGVVGAGRLAAMAAEFEAALKAGATGIDLFALRDVLAETSLELGHVVTSMKPAPRSALCTSSLAAGFAELDGLLQARNMRALDISASIEESLRDIPGDPFAVVSQAVDKLDFVAARKALRAMVFEAQAG